jgi:hypothetical protein
MPLHRSFPISGWLCAAVALAGSAGQARAGEVDRYLPADSQIVINVNVRQLLDSELVKKHALDALRDALKSAEAAEEVLKDLGFDPFRDLDRLIIASPGDSEHDRGLVIAYGRFDPAKFKAKAEEIVKTQGDVLKVLKVPGGKGSQALVYQVSPPELPNPLFIALLGDKTLLASPGKDYVVDALRKASARGPAALKDKDFQALLETVDDRQTVSLAAVSAALSRSLPGAAPPGASDALGKITALGGGLTLGEDVQLEVAVSAATVADAREFYNTADKGLKLALGLLAALSQDPDANPGLELALEVVKSLRVSVKDRTVLVKGRLNAEAIGNAVKKLK